MTTKILSCSFEGFQNLLVKNKIKRLNKYNKAIDGIREVIMIRIKNSMIFMMSGGGGIPIRLTAFAQGKPLIPHHKQKFTGKTQLIFVSGGGRIRTYGPIARSSVFKTDLINHSKHAS